MAKPGNDSASTPVVLFHNGFEIGGNGSNSAPDNERMVGELRADQASVVVQPGRAPTGPLPSPWLRAETVQGRSAFFIDRAGHNGELWLRPRIELADRQRAGTWQRLGDALGLALVSGPQGLVLLVDSDGQSQEVALDLNVRGGVILLADED